MKINHLTILFIFCFSCVNKPKVETTYFNGKEIFISKCSVCHGDDGKKGLGGASDLTVSNLDSAAFYQIINNGRRGMPPFESSITAKEKEFLFIYLNKLKVN